MMTNKEAFALIGKRAEELSKNHDVQEKMMKIARAEDKESAEKYLYFLAIYTLCGV